MIALKNLSLQYSEKIIFDDTLLSVSDGEKIGLIGKNGSGKSTLFNIIGNKKDIHYTGKIEYAGKPKIGYLPQELSVNSEEILVQFAKKAMTRIMSLEEDIERIEEQIKEENSVEQSKLAENLGSLHEDYGRAGGYYSNSKTKKVLAGLGFTEQDMEKPISTFSGGWQIRAYLGQILLGDDDLLLLDEPTNHLDMESVIWLENYLYKIKKTIIIISHDYSFLDKIVDTTVSIENCKLIKYSGNIASYEEQREIDILRKEKQYIQNQKKIASMEAFVNRFRYKASKAKQAQSRLKRIARLREDLEEVNGDSHFNFQFPDPPHCGKEIMQIDSVFFHFKDQEKLLENVTIDFFRGDKYALFGKNGTGKSTFVKLISGLLKPTSGEIHLHPSAKIGYFAQHTIENLNNDLKIYDEIEMHADVNHKTVIREILGLFMFSGDEQFKMIKNLSGGEKARVALAKLFVSPANFLILDEPTNHLDIESKQVLIQAINQFTGSVLVISHDMDLFDSSVEKILYLEEGTIKKFEGNFLLFQEFLSKKIFTDDDSFNKKGEKALSNNQKLRIRQKDLNKQQKRMQKELENIERKISAMEEQILVYKKLLASKEYYMDGQKSHKLKKDMVNAQTLIEQYLDKWEIISTEIDSISKELNLILFRENGQEKEI